MDVETLLLRRFTAGWLAVGLGCVLTAAVACANELPAASSLTGLVIHGPEVTLRDYCRVEDGRLWLCLPHGARFELVTSTLDPVISNPGDGSFHPFDEAVVRAALDQVRFPLHGVAAEIFLLPYPRRDGLQSAAGNGLILLSPGVLPPSAAQQHAELVHELGHVVQYGLMPDHAGDLWSRYRTLRGLTDLSRYSQDAAHADRPHEIFAEDFRALFGGGLANYSGTIENPALCMPQAVSGLEAFMLHLAGIPLTAGPLEAYPIPSAGSLRLRRSGGEAQPVDVFDVTGRRVATLDPTLAASGWEWRWDGRDHGGRTLGPGVWLARARGSHEPAIRLVTTR